MAYIGTSCSSESNSYSSAGLGEGVVGPGSWSQGQARRAGRSCIRLRSVVGAICSRCPGQEDTTTDELSKRISESGENAKTSRLSNLGIAKWSPQSVHSTRRTLAGMPRLLENAFLLVSVLFQRAVNLVWIVPGQVVMSNGTLGEARSEGTYRWPWCRLLPFFLPGSLSSYSSSSSSSSSLSSSSSSLSSSSSSGLPASALRSSSSSPTTPLDDAQLVILYVKTRTLGRYAGTIAGPTFTTA